VDGQGKPRRVTGWKDRSMRIVLDTNVLVSGLYNPNSASGRIIDLILGARIQVLYADRILAEYLDMLAHSQLAVEPCPPHECWRIYLANY
jgi:hypothetical protein